MRVKIVHILFMAMLLFALTSAQSSDTQSEFDIAGCTIGLESFPADSCSTDGQFYCGKAPLATLYKTTEKNNGCSFGNVQFSAGTSPQCCPAGYICTVEAGGNRCKLRSSDCTGKLTQNTCNEAGCYWLEGTCVDRPQEYSCDVYKDQTSCRLDVWNLGTTGLGTATCGTIIEDSENYAIPKTSCGCTWEGTDKGCVLEYDVKPDLYWDKNGFSLDSFSCQKSFETKGCVSGTEEVSWTATTAKGTGEFATLADIPDTLKEKASCEPGSSTRVCGQPIIRLPGVSTFSIIASLLSITLFYLFRAYSHKK